MAPPIRSSGGGVSTIPDTSASAVSAEVSGSPRRADVFHFSASPLLDLRSDLRNPIRSSRTIRTLGDLRDAIELDFIRDQLGTNGEGAEIIQRLGSFPGFLRPSTPLGSWNPDEKPDFNVIGNAEVILRRLAPIQGWSDEVLERNLTLARRGMVYYNIAIETPQGPTPFKMGILDTRVWREGSFYFDLRASMLPATGTYVFLRDAEHATYRTPPGFRAGDILPGEFNQRLLRTQAEIMGRSLDTLVEESFSGEDLVARRFRHQFAYYERYRIFERSKGAKQRARFNRDGANVGDMIVPGLMNYLLENPDLLEIRHGDRRISAREINSDNLAELRFTWLRPLEERQAAMQRHLAERSLINSSMWQQTLLNIASNKTSRPGYHGINWVAYGARKFGRWFGLGGEREPITYTPEASFFNTTEERLGRGENPISQMIILAGYGPGDESDPKVFTDMADYAEAEIAAGKNPNVLFRGNSPSKFTLPIRGVPTIAYRFIDALRSPAIRDIVVVGTPDVIATLEAFQTHFAEEIAARGKRFIPYNTGLEGGGFTKNIQDGLDHLPRPGEMTVLSFGDTPRVDIHNVAYHPYRHNLDFTLGTNSRDLVLDFMGMNPHYQMNLDGVEYPFKEGNVEGVRHFPRELWEQMFINRKSVRSGSGGKAGIFLRYLGSRLTYSNPIDTVLDILRLGVTVGENYVNNRLRKSLGGAFFKYGGDVEIGERIVQHRVGWRADFRPFHLDMGGLVDVDGIRDYFIGEVMAREHESPHQADLDRFARETLPNYRDRLPLLEGTPHKINQIYLNIYEEILRREAERPTDQKLGITHETLVRKGFDPSILPYGEDGRINQEWLDRTVPPAEIDAYRKAFRAYDNRVNHAVGLLEGFNRRIEGLRPYDADLRVPEKVQRFALRELNVDPERYRGLILEWNFDRLESMMVERAQGRFGEFAPEVEQVREYFNQSTEGNLDTPLRRVLNGFKAVDVLRRYQSFLAPAEFQNLYPTLVESIGAAREVVSGNRWMGVARRRSMTDGRFFLRGWLDQAQKTADEIYVRRVGESPPAYRASGLAAFTEHSNSRPRVYRSGSGEVMRADSAVWRAADAALLARRLEIMPSRIPHLIAAAAGVESRNGLADLPAERMTYDRVLAWTQTTEGQRFLGNESRLMHDRWENRLREGGPGLVMGLTSLLGGEYLADRLGLDGRHHPHERFAFVVGAGHLVNVGTSAAMEIGLNRALGQPFDFVTTRAVNAGGDVALQYGFEARGSFARALGASLTSSLSLEGGVARMALNGTRGLALLPFRSAWGMGAGLMSSAIVDQTIGRWLFPDGGPARTALHLGSFFLPELYHIGVGNRGAAIFESRAARFATRAFAVGFLADMTYMGINRLNNGSEGAATNNLVYAQANELYDQHERGLSLVTDGVLEMMAPSLMAWWDSVDFDWGRFRFTPNRYQREVRSELESVSTNVTENGALSFRGALLFGVDDESLSPEFYQRVEYGFLRGTPVLRNIRNETGRLLPVRDVFEQIGDPEIYRTRLEGRSHEEQIRYIQNQFRGHHLSRGDVESILQHIGLHRIRSTAASLHAFELPENAVMRDLIDANGSLRPGRERAVLRYAFGDPAVGEGEVVTLRQVGLAYRILEMRAHPASASAADLPRYERVAREVGLLDASGNFVDGEVYRQAQRQYDSTSERRLLPSVPMHAVPMTHGPSGSLLAMADLPIRTARH